VAARRSSVAYGKVKVTNGVLKERASASGAPPMTVG
jgi:hypothetical protein